MRMRIIGAAVAAVLALGAASAAAGPTAGPSRFDRREADPSRYTRIVLGAHCREEDDLAHVYLRALRDDVVVLGCRRH